MKGFKILLLITASANIALQAQLLTTEHGYTRADSLRGELSPLKTSFDVYYYDLYVKVDIGNKFISGSNIIYYKVNDDFTTMQIDLFNNLYIEKINYGGKSLKYEREYNGVFVHFDEIQKKGTSGSISIGYSGFPIIADNPPWDGGFTFTKDEMKNDWVGISCEGLGASSWWPNKDHLSDEPDSMMIHAIVPDNLICVANGNLRKDFAVEKGWHQYDWFVSYPINNYNVSLNIGRYVNFSDKYISADSNELQLDYYVMEYNLEKAKKQFEQVKPMLACYEKFMGKYPFYKDGFALVETPYVGMEHQSAIAYGNKYKNGYAGIDYSRIGLPFDYIIIHETGHEWWGNNVSVKDIADLWIHEGFCTYAEAIYVECLYGYEIALQYVNAKKIYVANDEPIIGDYNVNDEGSGDMYHKGALLMHTLRSLVDNDELWWNIMEGIQKDFALQTVTTRQIEDYISAKAGKDFSKIFNQYLRNTMPPVLEYSLKQNGKNLEVNCKWKADVKGFDMPVRYKNSEGGFEWLKPTTDFQKFDIKNLSEKDFKWDEEHFYFLIGNN
jgi:aminopeptidase N